MASDKRASFPYASVYERYAAVIASFISALFYVLCDIYSFVITDGLMYLRGKAYKPTQPTVMQQLMVELKPLLCKREPYPCKTGTASFIDLGCGQATLLPSVRACGMFDRVIGVELDEATYREAVRLVDDKSVELHCCDMFDFVRNLDFHGPWSGQLVIYMYEPLWKAGLPTEKVREMYDGLLTVLGARPASLVVYVTGVHDRHISVAMLETHGLKLRHQAQVNNSGVVNKLSRTSNTMEIWEVA